jgi:hypothetical protein
MVYFSLKDRSPEKVQTLIAGARKYLTGHPGTVYFGVGTCNPDLARPVNVRDFDVALQVIFASKADHDAYQVAQRHQQFIDENKPNWAQVRVFDADVE